MLRVAIFGTGITLHRVIRNGQQEPNAAIGELRRDVSDVRQRMARMEGLFEGFTAKSPPQYRDTVTHLDRASVYSASNRWMIPSISS